MQTTHIKVAIRIRPFLESEIQRGYQNNTLQLNQQRGQVTCSYDKSSSSKKAFSFDHVFNTNSSQKDVYSRCEISKLVSKAIDGYHSTIFAYGQTGSGKTFTMQGKEDPEDKSLDGIVPKAINQLFQKINLIKNRTFIVSVSFLQIYNQKVFDLLNPTSLKSGVGLKLRWNKNQQFNVQNLFVYECKSSQELTRHFIYGLQNRVSSSHKLNMNSSRSHSILTIRIQSFQHTNPTRVLCSKIQLVDLAGSERIGLTGAEGKLAKESIDINKSLFTLRQVISTLSDWGRKSKQASQHIPYRDSKLTSILKQSIGGNSYCLMIACISPNDSFFDENISTLTYATKATMIINKPIVNDDPNLKQIQELRSQVKALTQQLAKANRHIDIISSENYDNSPTSHHDQFKYEKKISMQEVETATTNKPALKKRVSERLTSGQYSQFSDRLVQSINTVRQLLKSNKELREQLQIQKQNLEQKDVEIFSLQKQNEQLRQRANPSPIKTIPNVFQDNPIIIPPSTRFGTKHSKSINRDSSNFISGNMTVHNFHTRPVDHYEAVNSTEMKRILNDTAMDSMPTNFNKRQVSTAKMNMNSRTSANNTIERYRKTFTSKNKRHSMEVQSFLDTRRSRLPFNN